MRTVVNVHGLLYRVETASAEDGGFHKTVKFKGQTMFEKDSSNEKEYHSQLRNKAKKMGFGLLINECSTIN